MVRRLRLTNFKSFRALDVGLRPFTVLIGPNGVGKTSVLRALQLLCRVGAVDHYQDHKLGPFAQVFSGVDAAGNLVRRPDANTFGVDIELAEGARIGFEATVEQGELKEAAASIGSERIALPSSANPYAFFHKPEFARLASCRFLQLDPAAIARPSIVAAGAARLDDDGGGLATVLEAMAAQRDGSLERVEAALSQLVPAFLKVHFQRTELSWTETEILLVNNTPLDRVVKKSGPGRLLELEFRGVGRVPASQVSEGTLLVLALLAVVHGPGRPRLLLLDDVDRALHPRAQVALVKLLKAIVEADPGLQVVCTSHSPMVVAGCAPEEVLHLEFDQGGTPCLRPAAGTPPWMTPSEIMAEYFGIALVDVSETMQRYGLLAGDPHRSDAEDHEVTELRRKLEAAGANPGWNPVARKGSRRRQKAT